MKISEILLFPQKFFKSLNEKIITLYIGILFVGFVDVIGIYARTDVLLFSGKPLQAVLYNSIGVILILIVIGIIDVVSFSMPLFDFFRHIKKIDNNEDRVENIIGEEAIAEKVKEEEEVDLTPLLIKIMKVYVMAHIPVKGLEAILWIVGIYTELGRTNWFYDLSQIYVDYIGIIWFTAIITKGIINVLNLNSKLGLMTFITIYAWGNLTGIAIGFLLDALNSVIFNIK